MANINSKVSDLKKRLEALKRDVENLATECHMDEVELECKFAKLADEDWSPEFRKVGVQMAQTKGNYIALSGIKDNLSAIYWQMKNVYDIED